MTHHQMLQLRAKDDYMNKVEQEKRGLEQRREMGEEEYAKMIEVENQNRNDSVAEARNLEDAIAVLAIPDECVSYSLLSVF